MAKQKKITRKQLLKEPDEFITFTGRMIAFGRQYRKQILYTVGCVLVLLVAVTITRTVSNMNERRAQTRFSELEIQFQNAVAANGPEAAYRDVKEGFENALDKYSGKDVTQVNRFFYANICYGGGDYDKAIALYREVLEDFNDSPFYRQLVLGKLGHAQMAKSDTEKAIVTFETLVAQPDYYQTDEALFQLGLLYEASGDNEKSRAAFEKIVTGYPESVYRNLVEEKLG